MQQESASARAIPWFQGSIEEAFAAARAGNKPVFLYWGAQWCPPCQELKSTIFRRDEFIEQSKLFIPVYLDGDTERAQKHGERFAVVGYPTVVIFDPQGEEITRIPGGMNIKQYVGVLELALNALRPVSDLLQAAQAGEELRDDDWRLLANYSWDQDRGIALGEDDKYTALQGLAAACPERLAAAKSRLQMLAIENWADAEDRDSSLATEYGTVIERTVNDPMRSRENLNLFIASGASMVTAMTSGEQRAAIRERIAAYLAAAIGDPDLAVLTRLDAIHGWVEVNRTSLAESEPLAVAQQEWVTAQATALQSQIDRYQQHAALNSLAGLYLAAGLEAEARATLQQGMEVSTQPYYFMSGMAYLETRAGNTDAAITWHRKAWNAARGPATRIQWGSSYLFALIELDADNVEAINTTGTAVLAELAQQQDGLYQRSSGRMDRLSSKLQAWAGLPQAGPTVRERRQEVLNNLRGEMDRLCAGIAAASEAPASCHSFLVPRA